MDARICRTANRADFQQTVCLLGLLVSTGAFAEDYPVRPVPFTDVHVTDEFWLPRMETNRTVTIPYAFEKCQETGRVDNFAIAGGLMEGEHRGDFPFDDTDVYKIIEGSSYTLSLHSDPKLEQYLDEIIAKIAAAQEDDGYLYTCRTNKSKKLLNWYGDERWSMLRGSHEMYNAGHMYEAAVAYYQATGKRAFLDVALRSAELIDRKFGPDALRIPPGHQVVEMGLAKLYRVTGEERYVELAKFLLDVRGRQGDGRQLWGEYNQDHKPIIEQTQAVGHAVRATYMYSGMADIAALTGDAEYAAAIDRIWDDVVSKKLYVTGGIGARHGGEAFGDGYELPNMSAYNETCAAIGNVYWNHRLFLLHGDAKYIDVMERTLYNGLISGISLEGKSFFYPKHRDDVLYVNLFASSDAAVRMGENRVHIRQETRYPWDGGVKMTVRPEGTAEFALHIRVPGWARNEPVPTDLYRFMYEPGENVTLKVNGTSMDLDMDKGYARVRRTWTKGDVVELDMPMPIRRVVAHENIEDDRGKVALQRGPIVYCAEWPDFEDGRVLNLLLPDDAALQAEYREDMLHGIEVIRGKAFGLTRGDPGRPVEKREQDFLAIPYYAWAHRGAGEMVVWLPREESAARPLPGRTIASTSRVTVSRGGDVAALNDQYEPKDSNDHSNRFFHWWPRKGTEEWVQYDFKKKEKISAVEVYWFDDTGRGECRIPESWRLMYRDGDLWKPVANASPLGVAKDTFNRTSFEPVETNGLRLVVQLPPNFSTGIHEWRVE